MQLVELLGCLKTFGGRSDQLSVKLDHQSDSGAAISNDSFQGCSSTSLFVLTGG
ncbi:hypothetical protein SAMN04488103_1149 [Gemmobacter aquatilis]|uniref:Uncharacterized protein n=1 Tax=Gemmobacter aquatilis TaxID=933059 RepID=A0A1H8MP40_9RHOB|nr:hypothetical protein [Gemmobacter aquatilis]SEO18906.1 hypothetical protein SAMN04488103_1149 [Gemmobacter aquatilis]